MALTIPDMTGGYQTQYDLRRNTGMPLLPLTKDVFRQAVVHLQSGGLVVTGLDRPLPDPRHKPRFFGRPSSLPVHYISMALKASVPVVVIAAIMQPDGTYTSLVSDPLPLQSYPDRQQEIIVNTEAILCIAEGFIRQAPRQWSMTLPVWPDALDEVP
jgi:KDO2-lipid IV(A) lauroyltransferase